MLRSFVLPLAVVVVLAACTPALDWREVRPSGSGLTTLFPCKPDHETRKVVLAGAPVAMTVHACSAAGTTWAVGFADVADPRQVGSALDELAAAAGRNVGAELGPAQVASVTGMTPHPRARGHAGVGRLPDGSQGHLQVLVFSKGTRVFQATIVGREPAPEAARNFVSALRFES